MTVIDVTPRSDDDSLSPPGPDDGSNGQGADGVSEWRLVRTRPRSEYLAASSLELNRYEVFFPRVETPRPRSGRNDTPLFPGYLFVRSGGKESALTPVNRIAGLLGLVQFDGVVPHVPDGVIAALSRRVEEINSQGGQWTRYWPGDKVRVLSGWIEAFAEVLEEAKSPETRVRVLMNFMGRMVPATVPWQDLQPTRGDPVAARAGRRPRRTRGKGRWVRGFGPRAVANSPTLQG